MAELLEELPPEELERPLEPLTQKLDAKEIDEILEDYNREKMVITENPLSPEIIKTEEDISKFSKEEINKLEENYVPVEKMKDGSVRFFFKVFKGYTDDDEYEEAEEFEANLGININQDILSNYELPTLTELAISKAKIKTIGQNKKKVTKNLKNFTRDINKYSEKEPDEKKWI